MKKIYFVRHGKADKFSDSGNDTDRLITDVGVVRTIKIAQFLADSNDKPEHIISSSAKRAYSTTLILADKLGIRKECIETNEDLFLADSHDVLNIIANCNNDINKLMIVGHNPTITQIANRFIDSPLDSLPTSGVIAVNIDANSWADISKANSELDFKIWPGML